MADGNRISMSEILDSFEAGIAGELDSTWKLSKYALPDFFRNTETLQHKSWAIASGRRTVLDDEQTHRMRNPGRLPVRVNSRLAVVYAWKLKSLEHRGDFRAGEAALPTMRAAVLEGVPDHVDCRWTGGLEPLVVHEGGWGLFTIYFEIRHWEWPAGAAP